MFSTPRVAVRLESFGLGVRKRKDTQEKVLKLTLSIQPFKIEHADDLGVKRHLFVSNTGNPLDDIDTVKLNLGQPMQRLDIALAPDQAADSVTLTEVAIGKLSVRKDKEGPVFAASLPITATMPNARDLLFLAERYTEQVFVTFTEQQGSMLPDPDADASDDAPAED